MIATYQCKNGNTQQKNKAFKYRPEWESQIDLEEFTEEEIELEIEELIQNDQSMAPDPEEQRKTTL